MAESTLRETLETAFDDLNAPEPAAHDDGAASVPDTVAAESPSPDSDAAEPTTSSERARDEAGKFAKTAEAPKAGRGAAAKAPDAVPGKTPAGTVPPVLAGAPVAAPTTRAPQSLKPAARDLWGKLGPEFEPLKADIARRERETAIAIQKASEESRSNAPLQELLRPYESAIRAQGIEPRQYVNDVLQQAHVIFNGPPQNRAQALADIIMQAGVPPQLLDRALVARMEGGQAQQPTQQGAGYLPPELAAALKEFQQFKGQIDQARTQRDQQAMAEAESTAAEFFTPDRDFAMDVADDVATMIEVWGRQGKTSVSKEDLDRAYTIACQMNPDVAPLLEQRKAAEAAQKAMASTARSKNAASSIRSQPTAAPAAQAAGRRAVLESKYDELDQG